MTNGRIALVMVVVALGAGTGCRDREPAETRKTNVTLEVDAAARADLHRIADDTLSATARVVHLAPEPDGEAVLVTFADSARGISRGLALSDRRAETAQLLWPDSVTRAWWPSPHMVAFTTETGRGARVVVDVHASTLEVLERIGDTTVRAPTPRAADQRTAARAQAWVDSLRMQANGRAERSSLHYRVDTILPAVGGGLAAFRVVARDSAGRASNPAWYILHIPSGRVEPVDEIVGDAAELPPVGGWTQDRRFVYAKGFELWEARVSARPVAAGAAGSAETAGAAAGESQ